MSNRRAFAQRHGLELMTLEDVASIPLAGEEAAVGEQLAEAVGYKRLKEKHDGLKLKATLRELGVQPFTSESVERYKKQKVRESKRTWRHRFVQASSWVMGISLVGFLGSLITSLVTGVDLAGWLLFAFPAIGVPAFISGGIVSEGTPNKSWFFQRIQNYREEIPLPIADRILAIKRGAPEVVFYIDHLTDDPDPFLVAACGDQTLYVGVWDEPSFTATPIA
jgi:hypothetical protein